MLNQRSLTVTAASKQRKITKESVCSFNTTSCQSQDLHAIPVFALDQLGQLLGKNTTRKWKASSVARGPSLKAGRAYQTAMKLCLKLVPAGIDVLALS